MERRGEERAREGEESTHMCVGGATADLSREKPMDNVLTLLPHS